MMHTFRDPDAPMLEKTDIGIAMGGVGMVVIIVKLVLDIRNGESHLFLNKTTTIACRKCRLFLFICAQN